MTQSDKELLLKDFCARLPYGVKGIVEDGTVITTPMKWYAEQSLEFSILYMIVKNGWRPYLFPLSSMTEAQKQEFLSVSGYERREVDCGRHQETYYYDLVGHENVLYPNSDAIDWLNKNHFDYRGLIEKGLALDATGLNIY